jgi:hypothetical protein
MWDCLAGAGKEEDMRKLLETTPQYAISYLEGLYQVAFKQLKLTSPPTPLLLLRGEPLKLPL